MNDSARQIRPSTGLFMAPVLGLFLAPALLMGCGDEEIEGIEARLKVDFTATSRVAEPVDSWPDNFLTPTALKVGIKSVKLIKAAEFTPSYTIVDKTDPTALIKLEFLSTSTGFQVVELNRVFPDACPCDFDRAEIEFIFFDQEISTENTPVPRRIRFYTLDYSDPDLANKPVKAAEVLVGEATGLPDYKWVDTTDGTRVPFTGTKPANPLVVPAAMFPDNVYSSVVKVDINPVLEIPDNLGGILTLTLTLNAKELFFHDETDGTTVPDNTEFNFATDGLLNARIPDPSHYYPLYPKITAATP